MSDQYPVEATCALAKGVHLDKTLHRSFKTLGIIHASSEIMARCVREAKSDKYVDDLLEFTSLPEHESLDYPQLKEWRNGKLSFLSFNATSTFPVWSYWRLE